MYTNTKALWYTVLVLVILFSINMIAGIWQDSKFEFAVSSSNSLPKTLPQGTVALVQYFNSFEPSQIALNDIVCYNDPLIAQMNNRTQFIVCHVFNSTKLDYSGNLTYVMQTDIFCTETNAKGQFCQLYEYNIYPEDIKGKVVKQLTDVTTFAILLVLIAIVWLIVVFYEQKGEKIETKQVPL